MAKRKNPLKDLDAFLKQEAQSIVQPNQLVKKETEPVQEVKQETIPKEIDQNAVIEFLIKLELEGKKGEFYSLVQQAIEQSGSNSSEDKMLINTLLYLKDKSNWKENIREYWS